jgi:hypothetical protein
MAYINQNFKMYKGDHKQLVYTVEDETSLTGATIRWKLSYSPFSSALIEKVSTDESEITTSENTFTVYLDPADTEDLSDYYKYYHEAEIEDSDGYITTVATGYMTLYETLIE